MVTMPKHPKFQDLTGQVFERLTVLTYAGNDGTKNCWSCKCSCGNTKTVRANNLKSGRSKSCGCLSREVSKKLNTTHGQTGTKLYYVWMCMLQRCFNPKNKKYPRYGGRGITVCDRWKNSFENFLEDMGERPSTDHSIEREDNDGNYCPENCVWATLKEQSRNKSVTHLLTYDGRTKCLTDWAKEMGLLQVTLHNRIRRYKWSIEKALTTPVRK